MNIRYKLCPQFKVYDVIGHKWLPGLMFMNRPNFRSKICNTDIYGLRFNSKKYLDSNNASIFDFKTEKDKFLMVGSSTTFGVGSTSDEKTIPSIISNKSNHVYNFGGRAFNGFQEIILTEIMINKLKNIKHIILYSGINDIYMNYNSKFLTSIPGPFYFNKNFLEQTEFQELSFKRKILKIIFPKLNIDYKYISKKELIEYFIGTQKYKKRKTLTFPKIDLKDIISRNLKMWKILSKVLEAKITYFLPPFMPWSKDLINYTKEEVELTNYLNNLNQDNNLETFEMIEKDYEFILNLIQKNCEENDIDFYDCNQIFKLYENKKKWLFVDKAHLTDYGNEIISEYILSKL